MDRGEHVAIRSNAAVLRQIQTLFDVGVIGDLTDAQLLERFTTLDREAAELAFAALVERHGPMVLRVCRNLLKNPQDAEDACQATFFVLVRKARFLWVQDSLAPWLHRVAHRVASRARASTLRRREHERRAAELKLKVVYDRRRCRGSAGLLHEEIDRLPAAVPHGGRRVRPGGPLSTSGRLGNWAGRSARSRAAWREPASYCGVV